MVVEMFDENNKFVSSKVKEWIFERLNYGVGTMISHEMMENVRVDLIEDLMTDHLVISLRGWLMADEVDAYTETVGGERFSKTVMFPRTWWDHFKRDKFPPWLQARFPPKLDAVKVEGQVPTKAITLRRMAAYPHAEGVFPKLGHPVHKVMMLSRTVDYGDVDKMEVDDDE